MPLPRRQCAADGAMLDRVLAARIFSLGACSPSGGDCHADDRRDV